MINIQDLRIDPKSLGNSFLLTDITPVVEYKDGKRTDNVVGYRYEVAVVAHKLNKIGIKIDGPKQLELQEMQSVVFTGLEIKMYQDFKSNQVRLTATAESIKFAKGGN